MIPKECKRLAEVDFPIAAVSRHAAREKSIRHGHPSTLHLWWARRPLASCRAMLLALLLPDPCDPLCPVGFKERARELLQPMPGRVGRSDEELRQAILNFIGDFANWDHAANKTYLEVGRGLVKAAHPEETPLVVDPFAGGGSIPLEALRLGCDAFASDLNPVACLILKTMLEDIPRHGPGLADELRRVGAEIKTAAEKELAQFYPPGSDGARPIAYLWARAVRCETSGCGAEIPIFKTAWLSKRGSKRARFFKENTEGKCAVLLMVLTPRGGPIQFRIARGHGSEAPRQGFMEVSATKSSGNNSNVFCPCCKTGLTGARVMAQLSQQRGGCDVVFDDSGNRISGAYLLAVIEASSGIGGKNFRLPTDIDYRPVWEASKRMQKTPRYSPHEKLCDVRPSPNARGLTAPTRYGAKTFSDLFTARQRLALGILGDKTLEKIGSNIGTLGVTLILPLGRCTDQSSSHVRWIANIEAISSSFPRQAVQMVWDFVECIPVGDRSANYGAAIEWVAKVIEMHDRINLRPAESLQSDARALSLPDASAGVFFTDPPYYDAVPYADIADFFWVWLKRALPDAALSRFRFLDGQGLSPKVEECVWNQSHLVDGKPKNAAYFEESVGAAFREGRRILKSDGIGCVVFAHKTTEGWEALLGGLLGAGWVINGSWPIITERGVQTNAQNTASLASSIHLVCRPRTEDKIGDWADVLRELPDRVADWMARLEREGVRGADLVFACIGPALEIFSRYSRVETPEGREVPLAEYLAKVWEVVGRAALEQVLGTAEARARNGGAGALEEDARLTALFLWTLGATASDSDDASGEEDDEAGDDADEGVGNGGGRTTAKGFTLIFDIVRRFAQPLGIRLDAWEGRIIETEKGVVRLLPVAQRARQLFGEEGAAGLAARIESTPRGAGQLELFPGERDPNPPPVKGRRGRATAAIEEQAAPAQATTLDRVHAAMLLQSGGRANALRALLKAEQERGPDFLRLANALSALYPRGCEEKRLLDAMLLAVPR